MAHETISELRKRCADLGQQLIERDKRINELESEIVLLQEELDEDFEVAEDERLETVLDDDDSDDDEDEAQQLD